MGKQVVMAAMMLAAGAAGAQTSAVQAATGKRPRPSSRWRSATRARRCKDAVRQEKRKGKGGALGVVGGAVAAACRSPGRGRFRQDGGHRGRGGGRRLSWQTNCRRRWTSKNVWVTVVKMKDGSLRNFGRRSRSQAGLWAMWSRWMARH